jgi:small subunit ribosomal protein S29
MCFPLSRYAHLISLQARGAVLGAVSSTNPQFMVPLELREALAVENGQPAIGGRVPRSKTLQDYARGLRNIAVPAQLSVDEAATLFEVWMKDKALYGGELFVACPVVDGR